DIFDEVEATARNFSSAALPTVQSSAADKIVFSSLTPLQGKSVWPGRVDVFRQPLLEEEEPTFCGRRCREDNLESGCQVWNAGDTILGQAPLSSQITADPPDGNLGPAVGQRRVFYPPPFRPAKPDGTMAQPIPLRLLELPDLTAPASSEFQDWREVFVRPSAQGTTGDSTAADQFKAIYRATLGVKNDPAIADPCQDGVRPFGVGPSWTPGDYLLGDVFHSSPVAPSGPSDLRFLRRDLCGQIGPTEPNNCPPFTSTQTTEAILRSYRNFARRNVWYRRMLAVAANDGQLHFFDMGTREEANGEEFFTDGTGVELFSYMPRMVMPIVREQALGTNHIFSLDGPVSIGEVVIDPAFATDPEPMDREWRTVMIGGLREGGDRFNDLRPVEGFVSGYYALDITQPDGLIVDDNGTPTNFLDDTYTPDEQFAGGVLPSCMLVDPNGMLVPKGTPACDSPGGANVPFPALKWEFTDRLFYEDTNLADGDSSGWFFLDEDQNGHHDLANTWSKPLIAQVPVTGNSTRWVAIFGGGVDPADKLGVDRGGWLYMIDVETGTILYKRPVDGAVPGDVTGLDEDRDGIMDVLYFGTTAGFLYKVDLRTPAAIVSTSIVPGQIIGWPGGAVTVERVAAGDWVPLKIFDTGGRPLFFPPAPVLVAETDQVALAFGTGDREDLWSMSGQAGRFYVVLDQDFSALTPGLPLVESQFFILDFNSDLVDASTNFLLDPQLTGGGTPAKPGWVMRFPADARVTARAFALSGVLVFSVFQPEEIAVNAGGQNACRRAGLTRTFVVDVRNGNALTTLKNLRDPGLSDDRALEGGCCGTHNDTSGAEPVVGAGQDACGDRCSERADFGGAPFVASVSTRNVLSGSGSDPLANAVMRRLLENIKTTFFPANCKFSDSFVQMIRMQFSDRGIQNLVPVPIGLCPSDAISGPVPWMSD
ncbi:MAG: hypothetical protein D6696_07295, partial [Acidobacteria bacterium]